MQPLRTLFTVIAAVVVASCSAPDGDRPAIGTVDVCDGGSCSSDIGADAAADVLDVPDLAGETDAPKELPCGALACQPLGECDLTSGTCRCDAGAWFDGAGCTALLPCEDGDGACAPSCAVPSGPSFRRIAAGETLRFTAGARSVEVGLTDRLDATAPSEWVHSDEVELTRWVGRNVRIFARVAEPECEAGPWFNAVFSVADAYPGPPSEAGTDAVSVDDERVVAWASTVLDRWQGPEVDDEFSDPVNALGPAQATPFDVYSLGRGGWLAVGFDDPISDGPGPDLAVFENGFGDDFLEVAFIEVSSDGETFVRFDNASLTGEDVGGYGTLDTHMLGQLAGKYSRGWGSVFDLAVLRQREEVRAGTLDLGAVVAIRVVDVIGDGSVLDSFGRPIFDPYPTIGSAGFDLDGVAVLREPSR